LVYTCELYIHYNMMSYLPDLG